MKPDITFYRRFAADILSDKKTITIRNQAESHFNPGEKLRVGYEDNNDIFCTIEVISVVSVAPGDLTNDHARQENMSLAELQAVISQIYPGEQQLYVISFRRIDEC
ncbi:valyl-tRNA synthetase [Mangrovibacter sp. MFB070]|uniref:N(4)-acetylcytidine aminohydrolase n=1 Tax=Mangrovibacter sp. MFB070 TaxID=1224318 RepID=UPI0004D9C471|nr:N(4)-acetylcytidine aminohydrolase [Mangrovibacter sp. MFB070]KEA51526.1 valyl-tRNA synthetase [Mangrovibacter sp. MFB070]